MAWLENYHAQMWDKQIEEDLEAGRLDALLAEKVYIRYVLIHPEYARGAWK